MSNSIDSTSSNTTSISTASATVVAAPPSNASATSEVSSTSSNLLTFPQTLIDENKKSAGGKAEAFFKAVLSHANRAGGYAGWFHRKKTTAYNKIRDVQFESDGFGNQYVNYLLPLFQFNLSSCHHFTYS